MPLFLVESLSQFRIRHVVDAPTMEKAIAVVNSDDRGDTPQLQEFSQLHLGQSTLGARQIDDDELKSMLVCLANKPNANEISSFWLGHDLINKAELYDTKESV
jgi:hypothetical protein